MTLSAIIATLLFLLVFDFAFLMSSSAQSHKAMQFWRLTQLLAFIGMSTYVCIFIVSIC